MSAKRRVGKATGYDVREGTEAARDGIAARDELGRRAANRSEQSLMHRIGLRRHPLTRVREYDGELLDGVPFSADALSDDELSELRRYLRARADGELSDEGRERYEALVGKAADEPGLYERRRDELRRANEMRAEATKLARVFRPRRRDPEPGSIELPAFLFDWLTNGQPDTFDVTDLGVLAALVYSFANESAALFPRARFVTDDEGPSLVLSQVGQGPRLVRGADDTQHAQLGTHLAGLKRNGWVETHRHRGTYRIRPGARMRKLWQ